MWCICVSEGECFMVSVVVMMKCVVVMQVWMKTLVKSRLILVNRSSCLLITNMTNKQQTALQLMLLTSLSNMFHLLSLFTFLLPRYAATNLSNMFHLLLSLFIFLLPRYAATPAICWCVSACVCIQNQKRRFGLPANLGIFWLWIFAQKLEIFYYYLIMITHSWYVWWTLLNCFQAD